MEGAVNASETAGLLGGEGLEATRAASSQLTAVLGKKWPDRVVGKNVEGRTTAERTAE